MASAGPSDSGRSWVAPMVGGAVVAVLANAPWLLVKFIPHVEGVRVVWPAAVTAAAASVAGNVVAAALLVWGAVRLIGRSNPTLRLAHQLERRGDQVGAAELYLQAGHRRRALDLFRRSRSWHRAAVVAEEMGLGREAAGYLRRAGGRLLADAGRLYRACGDVETARRCDSELAEWAMSEGRYDEALESWLRAGEVQRAARAARVAVNEGRLLPTHPGFRAAVRAAEEARDFQLVARLREAEGSWAQAGEAWRAAGDHQRAAGSFTRAGHLDQAAREETASGRHREAVLLKVRHLQGEMERLQRLGASGQGGGVEAVRLRAQLAHDTGVLVTQASGQGMDREVVSLLASAGRVEEAVERLRAAGQLAAAAELAQEAQRWSLAAPLLEQMGRWAEASDAHELAGDVDRAARCAERAGEDERALDRPKETAHCLARLGRLQDALLELHQARLMGEACEVLRGYPGLVPDAPDVILDLADWARRNRSLNEAVACLQRAVVGLALRPDRLMPALGLARLLHDAGDLEAAQAQLERVLRYDYAYEPAQKLRLELQAARQRRALSTTQPAAEEPPAASDAPPAGTELRYEIQEELGRGGMGVVYRAIDTRLQREVALKVLRATSAEETARLEREARAAATLNHPGIVTIYDFQPGFGGHFIVMECVPGEALDLLLRKDRERVRRNLVTILARLADAVAFAHSRQVVHRDLKPGNILLTSTLEVKVLDFGIATRLDVDAPKDVQVCGTPFYMSPEQIRGEVPTPASDIYSIGATAFHLATGKPPFARGDVINAHLSQSPPDPLDLAPDLNPSLARVILRCLAKEPSDRFPSAAALRDELRALETDGALRPQG